jgi:hypothetical protein
LNGLLGVLWLRQVLDPFGHGTWTAAIAAVIRRERLRRQSSTESSCTPT